VTAGEREATLLRLPAASSWGAFHATVPDTNPPARTIVLTLYDANGRTVSSTTIEGPPER
jgi:hypothetical protein